MVNAFSIHQVQITKEGTKSTDRENFKNFSNPSFQLLFMYPKVEYFACLTQLSDTVRKIRANARRGFVLERVNQCVTNCIRTHHISLSLSPHDISLSSFQASHYAMAKEAYREVYSFHYTLCSK